MDLLSIFVTVVVAHFLALLSPGPDFVLIVKSSIRNKKLTAIGVVTGIAAANGIYIALCLLGVGAILTSSIVLMTILKMAGGLFLIYLGLMALRAKKSDYAHLISKTEAGEDGGSSSVAREFFTGLASGLLNPKNPLFYLSLFTLVLNNDVGLWFKVLLGIWMTLAVFFWDLFIVLILSQKRVRKTFNSMAFYIDKLTGAVLGLIGLKIIQSALFDDAPKVK